jgi:plastocyanin
MRKRWLLTTVGLVALSAPILTSSVARAEDHGPKAVTVNILGGDHFTHPGLITNDYHFPDNPITVAQGGTITFVNKTAEGHTISLVGASDVPQTTAQVDNCLICNTVNAAFGLNGAGPPGGFQLDGGSLTPDPADPPDLGAINSVPGPLPPGILIEDFDTPSHGSVAGDATIVDTSNPQNSSGFPTQRTIAVTAPPGLYHYMCTLHPWMQGTIRVVSH